MKRKSILAGLMCVSVLLTGCQGNEVSLSDLTKVLGSVAAPPSQGESSQAIKQALSSGLQSAVSNLGHADGFYKSAAKILMPPELQKTANLANKFGLSKYVTQFEQSMNSAAERAVPQAASVFSNAISKMSVSDAIGLLKGGDQSVTNYFKRTSEDELKSKFLPIVKNATNSAKVTQRYKELLKKTQLVSMLSGDKSAQNLDVDQYITQKSVDALFTEIAKQESSIRANPLQAGTALMRRVFSYYQ